ncbi:putative transposable element [Phytophthora palmivora]|uniref:Transposable element n=1 Tax=Phytophthora palmivora TaxID=4796 RepID=A0A2P4Y948_9STRA|nr:putative transposable element [Phytophthora palmivora]
MLVRISVRVVPAGQLRAGFKVINCACSSVLNHENPATSKNFPSLRWGYEEPCVVVHERLEPLERHLACKLLKSLYGLKQTPRVRYQTLSVYLISLGFHKLIKESCVFQRTTVEITCYIAMYVGDLLIIEPTPALVSELKSALNQRFSMTDLGEVKYLLGWSIQRDRKNRTIFIHQHKYATKVIDRFSKYIPYPIATPVERNAKISVNSKPSSASEKRAMKDIPYREAVGSVMYLTVGTRPDMAFYMREVSQFLANPGMEHWNAVTRGLKYFTGTKDYGLMLGSSLGITPENLADHLMAYSDSDYANCPDMRHSVREYVTTLAKGPIAWLSRKHHTAVLSTTEAEYIAIACKK